MNALTRIAIKHCRRVHVDWTEQQILDRMRTLTDASGVYQDTVTLQDVKDVIYSMPEYRPGVLL